MNLSSIADVLARIAAIVADRREETVWVGIDGFGGSGKTTLASWLAASINGSHLVSIDDFAGPGVATWDFDRFRRQVVVPLDRGDPASYERRGWGAPSGTWLTIPAGSPVIVEGVSCTDSRAAVGWDLTVWVHADAAERHRRIRLRDDAETLARWEGEWWPSEEAYAAEQHPIERVDVVVSGEFPGRWPRISPVSGPPNA